MRGRLQGVFIVVVTGGPRIGDMYAGVFAAAVALWCTPLFGGVTIIGLIAVLTRVRFWGARSWVDYGGAGDGRRLSFRDYVARRARVRRPSRAGSSPVARGFVARRPPTTDVPRPHPLRRVLQFGHSRHSCQW
jgi:hypothetical protein